MPLTDDESWGQTERWLADTWAEQVKAVYTEDSGMTYVVWRGVVPKVIRNRVRPYVDGGDVTFVVEQPAALHFVTKDVERRLRHDGVAVLETFESRQRTLQSGRLELVIQQLSSSLQELQTSLEFLNQEYALEYSLVLPPM